MRIIVMPGDGIGPEITEATVKLLKLASEKFQLGLQFEQHDVGFASLKKNNNNSFSQLMPFMMMMMMSGGGGFAINVRGGCGCGMPGCGHGPCGGWG